jgi:hypothetical protein
MNTNTPSLASLSEDDRLLIAAALSSFTENMGDGHPLRQRAKAMCAELIAQSFLLEAPKHVRVNEPEFQEFVSYLNQSEYWAIYWEHSQSGDGYTAIAEVAVEGSILHFEIADNLKGAPKLRLAEEDQRFVERMRYFTASKAPEYSEALVVAIIEVPVSWEALEGLATNGEALEAYLETLTKDAGELDLMTRSTFGDIHTNPQLAVMDYAGLTAIVLGSPPSIEALPKCIAEAELSLISPNGTTHLAS